MAKKRVHEIAKEIKAQGIELEPKELLKELQELDFPVKSHSSSLDEEMANSAIEKIIQRHKPTPAPKIKAAGFVVRRRAVAPPSVQKHPETSSGTAAKPPVVRAHGVGAVPKPAGTGMPAAGRGETAAPATRTAVGKAISASSPEKSASPVAAASVKPLAGKSAAAPETTGTQPSLGAEQNAHAAAENAARTGREAPVSVGKSERPAEASTAAGQARPAAIEPKKEVIVSGDQARTASRGAGGRLKTQQAGTAESSNPAPVDPKTLHPTANQAVVISRPLIPIRRVTPTSAADSARRNIPQAPGPRAISVVREISVGPGSGGRRDFGDTSRDQPSRKRSGARQDMKESYSKQELLDLARGRTVMPPLRAGKKKKPLKKGVKTQITQMADEKKVIKIDESINIADLSQTLGVKAAELIKKLMGLGMMATMSSDLDIDTATLLVSDYGWRVEKTGFEIGDYIAEVADAPEDLVSRPPVVTIMGHVDHGKTSLLDAIRNARVAAGEAGGITQHIGAYSVETEGGRRVTFLDTPGHEAFTAMRARGAKVTDLVVIVVAADDGVMPQTREAINHAKAAEVPILVAINKMDKPGANPQHVKNQLMEFGLVDESLGGDTIMVPVSAKTKMGLDNLLEMILLQSEVLDLKSNPNRKAHGTVVEAKLEKGRGPVATVIVSDGTLRVGDAIVSGTQSGKIRAMQNDKGEKVTEVPPGYPVEIVGMTGVPTAGDDFDVVESESAAKEIALHRTEKEREKELTASAKVRLEDLFAKASEGTLKELKLVIKADVQGSAEAVSSSLAKLATKKVGVKIIHTGVGGINGNDVMLAAASDAIIVGFNVRPELKASEMASQQGVDIRLYSIIYEAVDEVQKAMEGLLEPTKKEKTLGRAEVRNTFNVPKVGTIAGCFVIDGKMTRSAQVRLLRDSKVVYTGKVASLRRFKDDVKEVEKGYECGLSIENFGDIKQGDVIEAFEVEIIRQSLD